MTYRFLPHTADVLVAIEAPTFAELFQEATAVARRLLAGESPVAASVARTVSVSGTSLDDLLFEYLRELLYQFNTDRFVPARLELDQLNVTRAGPAALAGTVFGEPFDPLRHETQPEVKAVTRHGLRVTDTDGGFRAEILFDV